MNFTRRTVVTLVVVLGLLGVGAFAFAQTGRGPIAWAMSGGPPWADGDGWRGWGGHGGPRGWGGPGGWHRGGAEPEEMREIRAELAADLAAELDTTAEEVESAFRNLVAARLDEAVEAGRLDREDADAALEAYQDGDMSVLFRLLKRHPVEEPSDGTD